MHSTVDAFEPSSIDQPKDSLSDVDCAVRHILNPESAECFICMCLGASL